MQTLKFVRLCVKFTKRFQKITAILKRKNLAKDPLLPKETRFDASVVMVRRSRDLKMPLREAVVDEAFEPYLNDPSANRQGTSFSMTHRERAAPGSSSNFPSRFSLPPAISWLLPTVPKPRELYKTLYNVLAPLKETLRNDPAFIAVRDKLAPIRDNLDRLRQHDIAYARHLPSFLGKICRSTTTAPRKCTCRQWLNDFHARTSPGRPLKPQKEWRNVGP